MLEELLEKYKKYEPVLNYFDQYSYDCVIHKHPIGWHCSIAIKPVTQPYNEELYLNHKRIHTSGHITALDALKTAVNMTKLNMCHDYVECLSYEETEERRKQIVEEYEKQFEDFYKNGGLL